MQCDALPITQSLTVTASGKAYVAFVFSFTAAKVRTCLDKSLLFVHWHGNSSRVIGQASWCFTRLQVYDVIGVYEIRHSYNGKIRLVATWKLKARATQIGLVQFSQVYIWGQYI